MPSSCNAALQLSPWQRCKTSPQGSGGGVGIWVQPFEGDIYLNFSGPPGIFAASLHFDSRLLLLICEGLLNENSSHHPLGWSRESLFSWEGRQDGSGLQDTSNSTAVKLWPCKWPSSSQSVMLALTLTAVTEDTQNGLCKCLLPFSLGLGWHPFSPYQAAALVHPAVTLFA